MTRSRYLIAYDIRDPARLRRICKLMEGHGERLQFSVFICDLDRSELVHLRREAEARMRLAADSVVIVNVGPVNSAKFTFVGQHLPLPHHGPQIT